MKRIIGLVMILLIMLVTLTGCVNINYEVKINENGSGDVSYICGTSKETNIPPDEVLEEIRLQSEKNGYTIEKYEDDEIEGFKASKHLNDISKEFSFQEAFGEEYVKENENNVIKVEKHLFKTNFYQNAEIDSSPLQGIGTDMTMVYTIKLPTKAKTHNADEVSEDGRELTWNLKAGEINKVEFTAQKINIVPIIGIIIIIIVAFAVIIKLSKKHATKNKNNI